MSSQYCVKRLCSKLSHNAVINIYQSIFRQFVHICILYFVEESLPLHNNWRRWTQNTPDQWVQGAVWLDWIEQCFTSPSTRYRLYRYGFYRSKDPTNSIKVLKEQTWNLTVLSTDSYNSVQSNLLNKKHFTFRSYCHKMITVKQSIISRSNCISNDQSKESFAMVFWLLSSQLLSY